MESSSSNANSTQNIPTSHYVFLFTTLVHSKTAFISGDEMSSVSNQVNNGCAMGRPFRKYKNFVLLQKVLGEDERNKENETHGLWF